MFGPLNEIKYLLIHNVSIHEKFYQNRFLNYRRDGRKDGRNEFFL